MIAGAGPNGLTVDLLLSGYRLFGVTYQVSEKVRLGDVLNSRGDTVMMRHASIMGMRGQVMASLPEVAIHKQQLIAAIPKESEDYQQKQKLFRAGMVRPNLIKVPVLAVIPPYAAMGKIHVPPASDLSDPERSGLARFFPLTDAVIFIGEDRLYQGPIALLNRDLVAVLARTGEAVAERPTPMEQTATPMLADVISALNQGQNVRQ